MEEDTEVISDMAYRYCHRFFEDMPCPPIVIGKEQEFDARSAKAHYDPSKKLIEISPRYSHDYLAFNEIKTTIKHELIHAWTHWKGYYKAGDSNSDWHGAWFLWKAYLMNVDVQNDVIAHGKTELWEKIKNGATPEELTNQILPRKLEGRQEKQTPPSNEFPIELFPLTAPSFPLLTSSLIYRNFLSALPIQLPLLFVLLLGMGVIWVVMEASRPSNQITSESLPNSSYRNNANLLENTKIQCKRPQSSAKNYQLQMHLYENCMEINEMRSKYAGNR